MPRTIVFRHESAKLLLDIHPDNDAVAYGLRSRQLNQGHALAVGQKVLDYADERHLNLWLEAFPYGTDPREPGFRDLVALYSRYGFVRAATSRSRGYWMYRLWRTKE